MYSIFGDESSDETRKRVFTVGALFGNESDWADVEERWIARTGGTIFHAADCESDEGDYKDIPHELNQALYKDLAQIITKSKLMGFGSALDLRHFDTHFPDAVQDQPYYFCFSNVVRDCVEAAALCIPQASIEITFDRRAESAHSASLLYDSIARKPEWKDIPCIPDKITFATRKTVGIQVADLVARETMKHMDNTIGPLKRRMRLSMDALVNTHRFRFKNYAESFLIDLKRDLETMFQRIEFWNGYNAWRERQQIKEESMSSRLRYLMDLKEGRIETK